MVQGCVAREVGLSGHGRAGGVRREHVRRRCIAEADLSPLTLQLISCNTVERALQAVEALNVIRKGQVKRLYRGNATVEAKLVLSLFQTAA